MFTFTTSKSNILLKQIKYFIETGIILVRYF